MRSVVELLNRSPAEHDLHYGPKSSAERTMSGQGFTAVNGLDRRQSGTSSGATKDASTVPLITSNPPAQSEELSRGEFRPCRETTIRNDSVLCQDPAIKLSPDTAKRKRSMMDNFEESRQDSPPSALAQSPKRRMTEGRNSFHSNNPDGSTLSLLNTHVSIEPTTRERCSRERSPVPTRNQRMAPPQVRPETEAHLAESLATHLKDAKLNPATNGSHVAQKVPVPMQYEESSMETYSPGDIGDPNNKRKRNFSNRTKTGCHTCRTRKKKCDEGKPECGNCLRGGFDCTGYGPKPVDGHKGANAKNRAQIPLQSKVQDGPQESPAPLSSDGPRYDHWGRIPPPTPNTAEPDYRFPAPIGSHDPKYSHSRDVWRSSSWQYWEPEGAAPHSNAFSPVEHSQSMPPTGSLDHPAHHAAWRHPVHPPHYPGPVVRVRSRESVSIHSSHHPHFSSLASSGVSEKHKMLIGEPYRGHIDAELLEDRQSCRAAVERWNQAHQYARATSDEEKGRLFKAILDPYQRPDSNHQYCDTSDPLTRPGSLGVRVVIISPFTCDYGYNIHIGDDTYIGANCSMEDAGEVSIGARVHIGKDVLFCATNEPSNRLGSSADLSAGAIIIEDEVIIGPRTTILPHRVIGKGATIAAGSVVTRNIPPHTFAAGNPCRVIRTLPPSSEQQRSPEQKRHSRELTVNTTNSSIGSSNSEEDGFADKLIMAENERSLRSMRARKGIRE